VHLKARNLSVTFGQVKALQGVTLEARPGEVVAIFGANGSGKTTFLKAVAGLVPVSSGRITYHGEDITALPAHERVARGIHYVSDRARVALRMTVRENLDVGGYLRKPAERREALKKVVDLFPVLGEKAHSPAGILSGGERQMLVIGRALMASTRLMMLDEPSLGLSPILVAEIFNILKRLNEEQKITMLLVEQNAHLALSIAEHGYVMENGKIVLDDRVDKLKENEDIKMFYLGLTEMGTKRSYRDAKFYKRRKRWLT